MKSPISEALPPLQDDYRLKTSEVLLSKACARLLLLEPGLLAGTGFRRGRQEALHPEACWLGENALGSCAHRFALIAGAWLLIMPAGSLATLLATLRTCGKLSSSCSSPAKIPGIVKPC